MLVVDDKSGCCRPGDGGTAAGSGTIGGGVRIIQTAEMETAADWFADSAAAVRLLMSSGASTVVTGVTVTEALALAASNLPATSC